MFKYFFLIENDLSNPINNVNLIKIDVVIKDRDKRELLIPHIDNLLNTCALKLNVAHNIYLSSHDLQVEEVFRLFKGLFSVILDVSTFFILFNFQTQILLE